MFQMNFTVSVFDTRLQTIAVLSGENLLLSVESIINYLASGTVIIVRNHN